MAKLFDPTNEKRSATSTETPSPANQAMEKYKADILGQLLNYAAKPRPSFADFAKRGQSLPARLPGGLSAGIGELIQAMNQPGAFTSTKTAEGEIDPSAPSLFSDFAQAGALLGFLYKEGLLGEGYDLGAAAVNKILQTLGGAKGINGINPALGDTIANEYGSDPGLIPGGVAGGVPDSYPGTLPADFSFGDQAPPPITFDSGNTDMSGLLQALGLA